MKYYLIAGENSGDLHGANLMKEIKCLDTNANFRFCGGDLMLHQSKNICLHVKQMSFMGFIEVLMNIRTISKNMKQVKKDIESYNPDALILIDYPGFNLRMAEFANRLNLKVHYYISPKVWAWKSSRIKKIKAFVNQLYLILPFEEAFYKTHNYQAKYVGNPLLDAISEWKTKEQTPIKTEKEIIALLPGSRKMEVENMLPIMLKSVENIKGKTIVIAGVTTLSKSLYEKINSEGHQIVFDNTYQLLSQAHAAIVTSGTATLETALFNVPQVVCYKAHPLTIWIAKQLVKIKYISLVNLIMNEEVVKELIQNNLNPKTIYKELKQIIQGNKREEMLSKYKVLNTKMGKPGASYRVAKNIVSDVKV